MRGRSFHGRQQRTRAHGSPLLLSADFTGLTPGAVASLPGGLSFSRASSATVQTGTSTVVTSGIGTDVPRIGRALDADSLGLVMEPTRQNLFPYARDPGNAVLAVGSGDTYTTGQTSPDGTTSATRVVVTSAGYSRYAALGVATATRIGSFWAAKGPGTGAYQGGTQAHAITFGTAGAAWARAVTPIDNVTTSRNFISLDSTDESAFGGQTAQNHDAVLDLIQYEAGAWASEAIITTGASASRASERLYLPIAAPVVSAGRISLYAKAQFKHSPANADSAMRVWSDHSDATTYVEIATTGVMTVSIGGVTNTTNALSWAAGDIVELWIAAGGSVATVVKYRVNGGAVTTLTITGSALGAYAPAGALDLFCDSSVAKQPGIRLQSLQFYKSGQAPAGF